MDANGSGLHCFDFKVPDQVTWQPGPFLSDGEYEFISNSDDGIRVWAR